MARILCISSHVVRGSVGLAATVPALQSLGHEVWALPTVTLAARPGLGRAAMAPGGRRATDAAGLSAMLDALERDGCWPMLDAVLTGYFASPDTVEAAAQAVARIKAQSPRVRVLVDPVIGDAGRLYVSAETAAAIRDALLPLADIATPNRFELQWLASALGFDDEASLVAAARALGPPLVVVTSAAETELEVTTLLAGRSGLVRAVTSPRFSGVPNGSGDLLDGLFLGRLLAGSEPAAALDDALATLAEVLQASAGHDVLQLARLFTP
ncbi:MAG: PfkB family carbohydrate kinase [Hyphomicrobiaceae bacterium]|nr:PfkB family carbohydrate kinase [Hyphomicrobiaceae bacterium]